MLPLRLTIGSMKVSTHTSRLVSRYGPLVSVSQVLSRSLASNCYHLVACFPRARASHVQEACLDRTVNLWDKVNDFKWLRADVASPHWKVLGEDGRRSVDLLISR